MGNFHSELLPSIVWHYILGGNGLSGSEGTEHRNSRTWTPSRYCYTPYRESDKNTRQECSSMTITDFSERPIGVGLKQDTLIFLIGLQFLL